MAQAKLGGATLSTEDLRSLLVDAVEEWRLGNRKGVGFKPEFLKDAGISPKTLKALQDDDSGKDVHDEVYAKAYDTGGWVDSSVVAKVLTEQALNANAAQIRSYTDGWVLPNNWAASWLRSRHY